MTIRASIERFLSRGDRPDDTDELVEITVIPLGTGPITVESLRRAGFGASGAPTFNVITEVASDYRIMVPREQATAATARLDDLL